MNRKNINIGLFGFGCVGKGLYEVLQQTPGLQAQILKICVKDKLKERAIAANYFTYDANEVLYHPDINVIVELIDDSDAAFHIVSTALKNGKSVVTANKKMLAEHLPELLELQQKYGASLLYEAAACASIPVIRNLEEYYDTDLLHSFQGIVNGSTNYILTKIFRDNLNFAEALAEAQEKGFAESNPKLDVEGYDAKYKLTLLVAHAFGIIAHPDELFNLGIQRIGELDARYAKEKGYKIKLLAHAQKVGENILAFVAPQFVAPTHPFYYVDDEYNGVQVEGCFADKQFFIGKGAGSHPTASAVLSDISALSYGYQYEYKKQQQNQHLALTQEFDLEVFVSYASTDSIDITDFSSISERYQSVHENYICGTIPFQQLIEAAWLNSPTVSVILTPHWQQHKQKIAVQNEYQSAVNERK